MWRTSPEVNTQGDTGCALANHAYAGHKTHVNEVLVAYGGMYSQSGLHSYSSHLSGQHAVKTWPQTVAGVMWQAPTQHCWLHPGRLL